MNRRTAWIALAVVLAVALVVGAQGPAAPPTLAEQVERITSDIRCPTCQGLSAAVSDAPAAVAIREEVRRRLAAGDTERQIDDFLVGRYGPGIRLRPDTRGVGLVVWALPVVGGALAVVGLALAFRRWRQDVGAPVSAEDSALVARALTETATDT